MTEPKASTDYSATRFAYAKNGEAVTFVLGETWTNTTTQCPWNYAKTYAREFRYDGGRQRYRDAKLNTTTLLPFAGETTWSDYDGDKVYGDFTVTSLGAVTKRRSFEPGLASVEPWVSSGGTNTKYYHTDLLGTTRGMTAPTGGLLDYDVFTAFGEWVIAPFTTEVKRYGFAGAWGYQAASGGSPYPTSFPYLHVGARYYDPASGRFLQRDPTGIDGGLNVYAYANLVPTDSIDADGLEPDKGRGDDPGYAMGDKQLQDEINKAKASGNKQRVKDLLKIQKHKKLRNLAKRGLKKIGKKIPLVAAGCFIYDWYNDGLKAAAKNAANDATWPVSELWN